jgi:hypothetical protein
MPQRTFYNPPSSDPDAFNKAALDHLKSRQDDISRYMNADDPWETIDPDGDYLPPFSEYGLCFDAVENDETEAIEYFRFQISYGGPSEEYRFHPNGLIEFVYLDWFTGAGFDVSSTEEAQWLFQVYKDLGMMDFRQECAA